MGRSKGGGRPAMLDEHGRRGWAEEGCRRLLHRAALATIVAAALDQEAIALAPFAITKRETLLQEGILGVIVVLEYNEGLLSPVAVLDVWWWRRRCRRGRVRALGRNRRWWRR